MISKTMIFDEVALGLQGSGLTDAEIRARVEDTLKVCGLYPFRNWPISALSFGQKKRVTIASVLVQDPELIILDEPTSALDPLAEEELYQSYNELLGGRTMIFVSHRLSSTRFCDRILFLESGQIAEQGTFEELMEQKGKYAEMFHSQAKYYAGSTYGEAEEHE